MLVIKFNEAGSILGTRMLGKNFKNKIISNLDKDVIKLDFSGVEMISNSFADEFIGKMIFELGIDKVKKNTTFINVNKNVMLVLRKAINDRMREIAC